MTYDQAQSPRVAQRSGLEQPGIRLLPSTELPEVAYKGQLIYMTDVDLLAVYDGDGYRTIGDNSASRTFVSATDPIALGETVEVGDLWLNTATTELLAWDGASWVDPSVLDPDEVGPVELDPYAITDKHTIIGAVFTTAISGNRIVMRADAGGGTIKGYSGHPSEVTPASIDPGVDVGRPYISMRSGSMTGVNGGKLTLFGSTNQADFNCPLDVNGRMSAHEVQGTTTVTNNTGNGVFITAGGLFTKQSSSRRYKHDIEDLPHDPQELLKLRPVSYRGNTTPDVPLAGFIAEEADELGLEEWVGRDDEGAPEFFRYGDYTSALQSICRYQEERINDLEERLARLEAAATPD